MPLASNQPDPARLAVALAIIGAHAALISILMNLRSDLAASPEVTPVIARVLATAPDEKPEWQPPNVAPLVQLVDARVPKTPVIEMPMDAPPSDRAITFESAAAAPRPADAHSDLAKVVAAVEYLREPVPRYPPQSRKLREQGLVVLRVLIDEHGEACDVQIETSSGYERLDRAAREAIARAEFRPYVEDGRARRALVLIPIEFSLNRGPTRIAANGA
jgi:protein TonB